MTYDLLTWEHKLFLLILVVGEESVAGERMYIWRLEDGLSVTVCSFSIWTAANEVGRHELVRHECTEAAARLSDGGKST